jgi:hypothetical protein
MNRIGILNMIIGFTILFLAASGGGFVAFDMTTGFLKDPAILESWELALLKSAHGHSNLFGMIHIMFGLTLPYSEFSSKWKKRQTLGLFLGSLAMGPGMMIRAFKGPTESTDLTGILIGIALSASLLTLVSHSAGLYSRLNRKGL